MPLTLTTTYQPATDLGRLLHTNPACAQTFDLAVGPAHVIGKEDVTIGAPTQTRVFEPRRCYDERSAQIS